MHRVLGSDVVIVLCSLMIVIVPCVIFDNVHSIKQQH